MNKKQKELNKMYISVKDYIDYKFCTLTDSLESSKHYNNDCDTPYILEALYELDKDNFINNVAIQCFDKESIKCEDSINILKKNCKIKFAYYVINNIDLVFSDSKTIIKEMRCKNLLTNSELYFLDMYAGDDKQFDKIFSKYKSNFTDIYTSLETIKIKLKQDYNYLLI